MSILNSHAYKKMIQEDIDWLLENTEHSLERWHIIDVLKWSIKTHEQNYEKYVAEERE